MSTIILLVFWEICCMIEEKQGGILVYKIMGIDYGDARTGVAVSDLLCSIVGRNKFAFNLRNKPKCKCQRLAVHVIFK